MVSKKVLKMMQAFVNQYDGIVIKDDDEATFELESVVAWFDNYQYNIEINNDGYDDEVMINVIDYWKKYIKNKELVKSSFWNQGKKEEM